MGKERVFKRALVLHGEYFKQLMACGDSCSRGRRVLSRVYGRNGNGVVVENLVGVKEAYDMEVGAGEKILLVGPLRDLCFEKARRILIEKGAVIRRMGWGDF